MKLHISTDLSLPIDAATQTFAFIARKGAGKTYAAGRLAECLLDAHVQVVVLDSVGNWWGLRLDADGKSAGYDIPVVGGLRGDIPLEATGGQLIADILTDSGRSMILDVSQFSKADRQRFATAFAEELWKRKKAERHPSPIHLIIEESQLIVPESVRGDVAKMVGIYEEIIRLGRNYGIGVSMISQRPQSVNKEVLNQTECLFVLQVNGAHERKALKEWIVYHGADRGLVDELPSLPVGTAYVWSPQWLQILQKVKIGEKKTFDASATPKVGSHQVRRDLKPLDLDDLKDRMAATIERAKADDPRELRKEVAALKKQIDKSTSAPISSKPNDALIARLRGALGEAVKFIIKIEAKDFAVESGVDEAVITSAISSAMTQIEKGLDRKLAARDADLQNVRKEALRLIRKLGRLTDDESVEIDVTVQRNQPFTVATTEPTKERKVAAANGSLPLGEAKVLAALIQYPQGLERKSITVLTGYKRSTRDAYIARLGEKGYVISGPKVLASDEGIAALPDFEPLPTGEALQNYWQGKLPSGEWAILEQLIASYPKALSRDSLEESTGFKRSTRDAYIARLQAKELIVSGRGEVTASENLF